MMCQQAKIRDSTVAQTFRRIVLLRDPCNEGPMQWQSKDLFSCPVNQESISRVPKGAKQKVSESFLPGCILFLEPTEARQDNGNEPQP